MVWRMNGCAAVQKHVTHVGAEQSSCRRSLDDLLPLFLYVIVRAKVPNLVCLSDGCWAGTRSPRPCQVQVRLFSEGAWHRHAQYRGL
jgi:hypothetical protein